MPGAGSATRCAATEPAGLADPPGQQEAEMKPPLRSPTPHAREAAAFLGTGALLLLLVVMLPLTVAALGGWVWWRRR